MKKNILFIFYIILNCAFTLTAQTMSKNLTKKFEYKYKENDSYKILSTVEQTVYINGYEHHYAEIINRISVNITDVDSKNMTATHHGTFMTTENSVLTGSQSQNVFTYGQEYESVFTRDRFGVYTIDDIYFMPTVRDVPVFPDKELSPGDSWTFDGHEAHDFRQTFNMQKPYKVPFTANYKYLGEQIINDKTLDVFEVFYKIDFSVDQNLLRKAQALGNIVPKSTSGYSLQTIYWDNQKGCIDNYSEEFRINLMLNTGHAMTFLGKAKADVREFKRLADTTQVDKITQQLKDLNIENVQAKITDKGLTLSIENIQFLPDSNILLNSEKIKLNKIIKILDEYKNNDLLITGHTALRGTEQERLLLSEQRANAVATYLIEQNAKDRYHIFTKAAGGSEPIASNDTEEGRSKNRRVEITIMD